MTFLETKNGKTRRIPISPAIEAVLARLPHVRTHLFTNPASGKPYTVNGVGHIFNRALARAGICTGDVSFHTLRHTALTRMIGAGHSDHTVMAISGHSSTRMLERYTHPSETLKLSALETGAHLVTNRSQNPGDAAARASEDKEMRKLLKRFGGRREARTRGLRVAKESDPSAQPAESKRPSSRKARPE